MLSQQLMNQPTKGGDIHVDGRVIDEVVHLLSGVCHGELKLWQALHLNLLHKLAQLHELIGVLGHLGRLLCNLRKLLAQLLVRDLVE